ncbi:hypothetical protein P3X46_000697, partial [Hevea brasiliensis]
KMLVVHKPSMLSFIITYFSLSIPTSFSTENTQIDTSIPISIAAKNSLYASLMHPKLALKILKYFGFGIAWCPNF